MHKKTVFFFIVLFFSIIGLMHIKSPNSPILEDSRVFAGHILETGQKLYSWHNEELIIRDFFSDRKDGFFVDVGCAHYRDSSNTYYLEEHLGWSGIAVDALAEFALGYIENRSRTRFFNFIVTDHSGTIEPFYRQKQIEVKSTSSVSEKFVKVSSENVNIKPDYQVIYVPTITLTKLLDANGASRIDFLSLDIEMGELRALEGFDIERFRPKLVCVEVLSNKENQEKIRAYFQEHKYELIDEYLNKDYMNWYFRPKDI